MLLEVESVIHRRRGPCISTDCRGLYSPLARQNKGKLSTCNAESLVHLFTWTPSANTWPILRSQVLVFILFLPLSFDFVSDWSNVMRKIVIGATGIKNKRSVELEADKTATRSTYLLVLELWAVSHGLHHQQTKVAQYSSESTELHSSRLTLNAAQLTKQSGLTVHSCPFVCTVNFRESIPGQLSGMPERQRISSHMRWTIL